MAANSRYVPQEIFSIRIGTIMTTAKLKSQLVQVDTALALARVLMGLISAGYSHGRGNHVAPNAAMYVKRPTAAPLAALGVPGMRQAKVRIMDNICPAVPQRKSLRRPTRSMINHEQVEKAA